jgi:hypothetical protein
VEDTFCSKNSDLRIKEFGIGINPGAKPSEDIDLAKKVEGTVHIGFGKTIHSEEREDIPAVFQEFTLPLVNLKVVLMDERYQQLIQSGRIIF